MFKTTLMCSFQEKICIYKIDLLSAYKFLNNQKQKRETIVLYCISFTLCNRNKIWTCGKYFKNILTRGARY